ncbi:hypothetical protein H6F76_05330 [Leptolyngbya sp. FACHB-321]|uniref:hypothetical protein n=1 Tax=Leptolyngbya sp. FACHB-321 TaxID=2692807 RepID=UPI0016854FE2|nr:hypothetical protein [Leptolyngbya sp. FACHB-321]MBD2034457.1 hypothetical protein [Leptolyngbya sp. FACHB-321]
MQLSEVGGQLTAQQTASDVIHGLDALSEFQVSARVAYELRQSAIFLTKNYLSLAVGRPDQTASLLEWEITVLGNATSVHVPLKGVVDIKNGCQCCY